MLVSSCTGVITRTIVVVDNFFFIVLAASPARAQSQPFPPPSRWKRSPVWRLTCSRYAVRRSSNSFASSLRTQKQNHAELAHTPRPTMKTLEELAGAHGSSSRGMKTELFQT